MNLIEIFKAGKRKDANGIEVSLTPKDLQQAVESYNVAYHEAPAVIGHPKHNHPAYAWVKRLQLDGDVLKAEFDQIDPEFAEMVEKGRFKKVSASFYLANSPNNPKQGSLYLRHVGFLGAMPPAVKGLKNPEFNDDLEGVVEFEEDIVSTQSIPQQGDNPMDKDQKIAELEAKLAAAESAKTEAEQAKAQAESEANQLKADKAAAEEAKAKAELEATKTSNADFCEKLIADGKLAPVAKEAALALLNGAATTVAGQVVEFNEGESLLTLTKAFMEKQPKVVEFAEIATKDRAAVEEPDTVSYAETDDPARIELDRKARAYMKQHNCDYATAISAVM
ncbi:peptidase [Ursidibacter arcticus]